MGEISDLIISLIGKLGRFFNARGKRVCFLLWLICLSYWTVRNYYLGLKVQCASTFISAILNVYGFIKWGKKAKAKEE